jgi:hypothetical protein
MVLLLLLTLSTTCLQPPVHNHITLRRLVAGYPRISSYKTCSPTHNFTTYPLDAGAERTYEIIHSLLRELANTFGDPYVHLGGDMENVYAAVVFAQRQ